MVTMRAIDLSPITSPRGIKVSLKKILFLIKIMAKRHENNWTAFSVDSVKSSSYPFRCSNSTLHEGTLEVDKTIF